MRRRRSGLFSSARAGLTHSLVSPAFRAAPVARNTRRGLPPATPPRTSRWLCRWKAIPAAPATIAQHTDDVVADRENREPFDGTMELELAARRCRNRRVRQALVLGAWPGRPSSIRKVFCAQERPPLKRLPKVHSLFTPTLAFWLNQVETWFSILEGLSLHGASLHLGRIAQPARRRVHRRLHSDRQTVRLDQSGGRSKTPQPRFAHL